MAEKPCFASVGSLQNFRLAAPTCGIVATNTALAPKSMAHVRALIHALWDYAMWRGDVPTQRNPMELVTIRGVTKRKRQPRSLTVEEFRKFLQELEEPIRTIALVCVCFGLRISECLALKWNDIDWLNGKLRIERAIVRQQVDDVKTIYSGKMMAIDAGMLEVLKVWRQRTQFSGDGDWVFASPLQLGRLPISYPWVWKSFQLAASRLGLESWARTRFVTVTVHGWTRLELLSLFSKS
jgi:integrase